MPSTRSWRNTTRLPTYFARIVSAVFIMLGLVGFTNVEGWAWAPSLYHFGLGLLFAYAGFFERERESVLQIIQGLGVLMVAIKGITLLALLLLGYGIRWDSIEVSCFVVGIGSILVARYLRDDRLRRGAR